MVLRVYFHLILSNWFPVQFMNSVFTANTVDTHFALSSGMIMLETAESRGGGTGSVLLIPDL